MRLLRSLLPEASDSLHKSALPRSIGKARLCNFYWSFVAKKTIKRCSIIALGKPTLLAHQQSPTATA
jgi:hypothetical protein